MSEELKREDTFTSVHIVEQTITVRETKLGMEEVTRDIPNLSRRPWLTWTKKVW